MRIVVMPPFDREFFGGRDRLELEAPTLLALVDRLDAEAPGFAEAADARAAFAIDGVYTPDWTRSLAQAAEVILLPRVSGGMIGALPPGLVHPRIVSTTWRLERVRT